MQQESRKVRVRVGSGRSCSVGQEINRQLGRQSNSNKARIGNHSYNRKSLIQYMLERCHEKALYSYIRGSQWQSIRISGVVNGSQFVYPGQSMVVNMEPVPGSQYREPLRGSIELLTGVVSLLQTFKIAKVNRKTTSISTIQTPQKKPYQIHYDLIIGERIPELLSSIGERSRGSLSLGKLGYCHQVLCSPLLRIPLPGTGNQNTDTEILTAAPRSTLPILWLSITDPDLDTALGAESLLLRIRLTN